MAGWTVAGVDPEGWLFRAERVIRSNRDDSTPCLEPVPRGDLRVGVDLGTAYTGLVAPDEEGNPLASEYQFALVVDEPVTAKRVPGIRDCVIADLGGG